MPTVTPQTQQSSIPVEGIKAPIPLPQIPPETAKPQEIPQPQEEKEAARNQQMMRRERMMREEKRAWQAEKQAIMAEKAQLEADAKAYKTYKERLTNDTMGLLSENGVTSEQLTSILLNQPDLTAQEVRLLKTKITSLEENQNRVADQIKEQQEKAYTQAVNQIRSEIKLMVQGSEEFEAISNMNATEAVVEYIKQSFDQTGTIMSIEEAAKDVEEHLVEQALKMAQMKKLQSKLNTQRPNEMAISKPPQVTPTKSIPTLTHSTMPNSKPTSEKERRERAIAAFQGRLQG